MEHASLGGSTCYRWINCPLSVQLCDKVPRKPPGDAAMLGTAAHKLAEQCLKQECSAGAFSDEELKVDDGKGGERVFPVDAETIDAVNIYLTAIDGDTEALGSCEMDIEKPFDLGWLRKYGPITRSMFGTNDCCIYQSFGQLKVYDYKHGSRKRVDVERNEQLMYYALGRVGEHNLEAFESVELVVVQPRYEHPDGLVRRWSIEVDELQEWGRSTLAPAAVEACKPDCEAVSGEWCDWCPAADYGMCPIKTQHAIQACPFDVMPAKGVPVSPPAPKSLTQEQRSVVLSAKSAIEKWLKGVHAFEVELQRAGNGCPDFKLVNAFGNRAWLEKDPDMLAEQLDVNVADICIEKLISPAQAEKVLKEKGLKPKEAKSKLAKFVQSPKRVTLVSQSDPRPGIENPFKNVEEK